MSFEMPVSVPLTKGGHTVVEARIVGRLCVHRSVNDSDLTVEHWMISHTQSGLQIANRFPFRIAAIKAALELDALTDWDLVALKRANGRGVPELVPAVSVICARRKGEIAVAGSAREVDLARRHLRAVVRSTAAS
jgi:hypothetical protein